MQIRQITRNNSATSFYVNQNEIIGARQIGGGKTYRAIFGGETYYKVPPPKPVLEASEKWDLSGLCPFPLRRMTGREQRGGGNAYHKWGGGGSKTVFGAIWYVFPSPEFSPLCFPLKMS